MSFRLDYAVGAVVLGHENQSKVTTSSRTDLEDQLSRGIMLELASYAMNENGLWTQGAGWLMSPNGLRISRPSDFRLMGPLRSPDSGWWNS
jgi:hypothetical protein